MASDTRIVVTGLRDVRAALAALSAEAGDELDAMLVAISEEVVGKVRLRVPHRTGRMARSYVAKATARGASASFGGGGKKNGAQYVPWMEFGGSTGRGHKPGQGGTGSVKRPWVDGGRYLYPEIQRQIETLQERFTVELDALLVKYGMAVD